MKKTLSSLLVLLATIGLFTSLACADPIVLDPGTYEVPEGYGTLGTQYLEIDHLYYYTWCLEDLPSSDIEGGRLEIVFHNVYDWTIEEDFLNVYIRDGGVDESIGWTRYGDGESLIIPDWSSDPNWTFIDVWSDPAGHPRWVDGPSYDVVFTLNIDSEWANKLANDGTFVIGIDPDCHYYGSEITVNAPVPEPATLILLGSGLIGLAGFRKRTV